MGTRHLIAVQIDGKYKVAQYGQWDGYPSGQGVDVLAFLSTCDLVAFAEKVRAAKFVTKEEWQAMWVECGAEPGSDAVPPTVSEKFKKAHPEFHRDTGAGILKIVNDRPAGIRLQDNIKFAGDSLFCEWAYVVDLDKKTLEIFRGFNKKPLDPGERFAGIKAEEENSMGGKNHVDPYHQIKFFKSYDLAALPSEAQFLAELEPEEKGEVSTK